MKIGVLHVTGQSLLSYPIAPKSLCYHLLHTWIHDPKSGGGWLCGQETMLRTTQGVLQGFFENNTNTKYHDGSKHKQQQGQHIANHFGPASADNLVEHIYRKTLW